jgi:RNA polymerase sigma-70 factor (ECF subfamily)
MDPAAVMDIGLLAEFRSGKRTALARVYRAHVEAVERLARFGLMRAGHCSPANIADVVQEAFSRAFSPKARAAYDGEREYGPFLRQVARNTLIDWLRRNRKEPLPVADLEALENPPNVLAEPEDDVFPLELIAITRRFVSELRPDLKAVHAQRFLRAESQERAAQALGISRQTLRTLERRLINDLRRELRLCQIQSRNLSAR